MATQCSVSVQQIHRYALFSSCTKNTKKLICVSLTMWLLYLQGKCAIYSSQMVPSFSVGLQYFIYYYFFFFFSSQFLRSLNAFWSWGQPGNLRTNTNVTGFDFSLVSLVSFLPFFSLFSDLVFFLSFRLTQALNSGVLFLASFCIIVIYYTCNELVSIATFNSRSFRSRMGLGFLTYKTTEAFVKT